MYTKRSLSALSMTHAPGRTEERLGTGAKVEAPRPFLHHAVAKVTLTSKSDRG